MNVGVRKISLMVRLGSNPHHSWLGLTEQQNLTFGKGGKFSARCGGGCAFEKVVGMERFGVTGGASKARMP